eukprot:760796-Hanusia_phi.AAC.2
MKKLEHKESHISEGMLVVKNGTIIFGVLLVVSCLIRQTVAKDTIRAQLDRIWHLASTLLLVSHGACSGLWHLPSYQVAWNVREKLRRSGFRSKLVRLSVFARFNGHHTLATTFASDFTSTCACTNQHTILKTNKHAHTTMRR